MSVKLPSTQSCGTAGLHTNPREKGPPRTECHFGECLAAEKLWVGSQEGTEKEQEPTFQHVFRNIQDYLEYICLSHLGTYLAGSAKCGSRLLFTVPYPVLLPVVFVSCDVGSSCEDLKNWSGFSSVLTALSRKKLLLRPKEVVLSPVFPLISKTYWKTWHSHAASMEAVSKGNRSPPTWDIEPRQQFLASVEKSLCASLSDSTESTPQPRIFDFDRGMRS